MAGALALAASSPLRVRAATAVNLTVAGSTTLFPFMRDAAGAYRVERPDVTVTVTGGGSAQAIAQLRTGQLDMAASDFEVTSDDLFAHRIAVVGFAVAANSATGITALTSAQLRGILAGTITNYKTVGGNDVAIVPIERPPSSGIRSLIASRVMNGASFAARGSIDDGTTAVISDIVSTPGAIGYATFGALREAGLATIALDGAAANAANVANGTYPLWAYEYIITLGPATSEESRFLAFVQTNRALLSDHGYIAVQDIRRLPPGD